MSTVCGDYLKQIKRCLIGTAKEKQEFLDEMEEVVSAYADSHSNATIDDLVHHFGAPIDVAEEFAATSLGKQDIKAKSVASKRIVIIFLLVAVITALLLIGIHLYNLSQEENFRNGFYVETVTKDDITVSLEPIDENSVRNY